MRPSLARIVPSPSFQRKLESLFSFSAAENGSEIPAFAGMT
jgi:hypothetical protein